MEAKRVLITGGAGTIGSALRAHLGDVYRLESLDLVEAEGVPSHVADLSDLDAILPAFEGQDAVVHLGGDPNGGAPWESVLPNNIVGTYNVLEACRRSGVERFIFASSNHTVGVNWEVDPYRAIWEGRLEGLRRPLPMLSTTDLRPCCLYGVGKAFGENLASFYHDRYGLSCICIRIGGVSRDDDWRSHGELSIFFKRWSRRSGLSVDMASLVLFRYPLLSDASLIKFTLRFGNYNRYI